MPNFYGASPEEIFAREQQSRNGMTSDQESQRQRLIANLMQSNPDLAYDMAGGPLVGDTGSTLSSQEAWSRTPNSPSISDAARGPYGNSSYPPSTSGPVPSANSYPSLDPGARPNGGGNPWGTQPLPANQTQAYWDEKFRNDPQVKARQQQGPQNQPQPQAPVINIHVGGAGAQQLAQQDQGSAWDQWREFMKNSGPTHPAYDQSTPTYGQSGDIFSPLPNLQWPQQQGPQGQMSQNAPTGPPPMSGPRYQFPVQGSSQPGYVQDLPGMAQQQGSYVSPLITSPNSPYAGVVNNAPPPGGQDPAWYNQFLDAFKQYLYQPQGSQPQNNMYGGTGPSIYSGRTGPSIYDQGAGR